MLESGSWGHSVLQTPALVHAVVAIFSFIRELGTQQAISRLLAFT